MVALSLMVTCIKMSKQNCTIDTTKYFFSNRVIGVWNSLPDFIVAASSFNDFKKRVHSADSVCLSSVCLSVCL